ncbi:hypothetical protein [Beijerinckia sp. L45]|uniref:hypothetical protein n=1 Tax=Beijerinckia sp. L45 TaxID=1641855 RepID=UPI00131D80F9|nr:hypothetical protein [Beijerinckia sp. L45]
MNRIVREHYPVAALPEDLREGFEPTDDVRITVELAPGKSEPAAGKTPFSLDALFAKARPSFATDEEVAAHIDAIRDEWTDRR